MSRISRNELMAETALLTARRGTCSRLHVGVVVHREGRILVTGYNGAPAGMAHCIHPADEPLEQGCTVATHAEANAIAWAARHGIALLGSEMVVTHSPCLACAKLIINAGITSLLYHTMYRDTTPLELLDNAGISHGFSHI